jgi:hypothetical protein
MKMSKKKNKNALHTHIRKQTHLFAKLALFSKNTAARNPYFQVENCVVSIFPCCKEKAIKKRVAEHRMPGKV